MRLSKKLIFTASTVSSLLLLGACKENPQSEGAANALSTPAKKASASRGKLTFSPGWLHNPTQCPAVKDAKGSLAALKAAEAKLVDAEKAEKAMDAALAAAAKQESEYDKLLAANPTSEAIKAAEKANDKFYADVKAAETESDKALQAAEDAIDDIKEERKEAHDAIVAFRARVAARKARDHAARAASESRKAYRKANADYVKKCLFDDSGEKKRTFLFASLNNPAQCPAVKDAKGSLAALKTAEAKLHDAEKAEKAMDKALAAAAKQEVEYDKLLAANPTSEAIKAAEKANDKFYADVKAAETESDKALQAAEDAVDDIKEERKEAHDALVAFKVRVAARKALDRAEKVASETRKTYRKSNAEYVKKCLFDDVGDK